MLKLAIRNQQLEISSPGCLRLFSSYYFLVTKSCGLAVYYTWLACAQIIRLTHRQNYGTFGWVQPYGFVNNLCNKSTQFFPCSNVNFLSVISGLYPLSTQPIKTPTNFIYMKGL